MKINSNNREIAKNRVPLSQPTFLAELQNWPCKKLGGCGHEKHR